MQFSALPDCDHSLVALRPIEAADIPVWFEYLSQPGVLEHTSWDLRSPADLERYVASAGPHAPASPLRLAIALRSTDRLVGSIGFHTVSPENRSAEITYDLSPAMWGQGIASHVCAVTVAWAHARAGVARVQATVLPSNERSIKVLERCGFEREGLLRSFRMVKGRPSDFWMYSHVQDVR